MKKTMFLAGVLTALLSFVSVPVHAQQSLQNVSYDPTRELYAAYNPGFEGFWKAKTGNTIKVQTSHGGSGKQARAVIDGQPADVVTLGVASDIYAIQASGLIKPGWEKVFPNRSIPYTSRVAFVVRKGNPKGIHDWNDLIKPGVDVVTSNPKTSAGGRWAYLAAYGQAYLNNKKSDAAAKAYIAALYKNVPILDSGARGSTNTFVERKKGDVLIAWEDEALLITRKLAPTDYDLVRPSITVIAEPPVAIVDKNADEHGTRQAAIAYLSGLYTAEGQKIAAENFYRPLYPKLVSKELLSVFAPVKAFTFDSVFHDWQSTQKIHFDDGGLFDQIYAKH